MRIAIIIIVGWACHLVTAQEKVCSAFCSTNHLGMLQSSPEKSCDDIYQINKASRGASGNYWINTTTGVHQVYCDMELECGGHNGGWMRIADLDTSRGDDCPSGWTKITTFGGGQPSIDVCRSPNNNVNCYPTIFSVNGVSYHKICGKARGYQRHTTDAFGGPRNQFDCDINNYVDELSITIGNPRKHVWTYAAGFSEITTRPSNRNYCPCATAPGGILPPSFVGDHYYCESGYIGVLTTSEIFYTSDPLWDGSGCFRTTTECCANVNLPWFSRQFCMAQQDDIEVRICTDEHFSNEAVAVDQLQLFVL